MKRFFALTLVLCMALSMMAMPAFAAVPEGKKPAECSCSSHPRVQHIYVFEPGTLPGNLPKGRLYTTTAVMPASPNPLMTIGKSQFPDGTTNVPVGWYYRDATTGNKYVPCPGPHAVGDPEPKAQPKTGVEDTLPLWFGVMAVSACAYVLTSKRKFF